MPMIDVTAAAGTFKKKHDLAQALAECMMRWEKVPPIALFKDNTAAFIHDLPADALSNAAGASNYVRVNVLTPTGVLDRDKKARRGQRDDRYRRRGGRRPNPRGTHLGTHLEAPDGGWGIDGHAYTNAEIGERARKDLGK